MTSENDMEGVISVIEFPLGNDYCAVSKAVYQLLAEGWKFRNINVKYLSLTRTWEVNLKNPGSYAMIEEEKKGNLKSKISVEFLCKCGKQGRWITEGEKTEPCPHCNRIYMGIYRKNEFTIMAKEINSEWFHFKTIAK